MEDEESSEVERCGDLEGIRSADGEAGVGRLLESVDKRNVEIGGRRASGADTGGSSESKRGRVGDTEATGTAAAGVGALASRDNGGRRTDGKIGGNFGHRRRGYGVEGAVSGTIDDDDVGDAELAGERGHRLKKTSDPLSENRDGCEKTGLLGGGERG